jgi:hypothetical protein
MRSIQSAFTLVECRPERRRPLSWAQRATICTRHSACILAAPVAQPLAFPLRLSQCGKVAVHKIIPGDGRPVPTIAFHGDRDTTVHPNSGDHILEQSTKETSRLKKVHRGRVPGGHAYTCTTHTDASGRAIFEHWKSTALEGNPFSSSRIPPTAARLELVRPVTQMRSAPASGNVRVRGQNGKRILILSSSRFLLAF